MSQMVYLLLASALLVSHAARGADRAAERVPLLRAHAANEQFPLRFPLLAPTPQRASPTPANSPHASPAAASPAAASPAAASPAAASPAAARAASVAPQFEELPPPPQQTILAPAWQAAAPVRVLTHREFAATFQPQPGNYEVMLLHPYTRCPVKVCFSLPPGCLKEVEVDRNELQFDYGKFEVEVRFKRNGRVEVDLDD